MSKSGLLVAELLTSCFGETEAGSSWLVMNQTIACVPISATDKRWRAIGSREFVLVQQPHSQPDSTQPNSHLRIRRALAVATLDVQARDVNTAASQLDEKPALAL